MKQKRAKPLKGNRLSEAAGYNSVRSKRNVKLTERGENYRMNLVPSTTKRKTKWQLKIPLKSVENSLPANTIYRKKAARTPGKCFTASFISKNICFIHFFKLLYVCVCKL